MQGTNFAAKKRMRGSPRAVAVIIVSILAAACGDGESKAGDWWGHDAEGGAPEAAFSSGGTTGADASDSADSEASAETAAAADATDDAAGAESGGEDGAAPISNPLPVPYYYQYDNAHEPGATCGLTSAAMLLGYWGRNLSPDDLYESYGKAQGQSPDTLAELYASEGLHSDSTYAGTFSLIRDQIDAGRPVVVHGYFTSGHIVVIIGYDNEGFIINDPAGLWAGCSMCGYPNSTASNGQGVRYDYESLREVLSWDGDVWMSTADAEPFSLW